MRKGSVTGAACRQNSPCLFSSIFTAGTEIRAVFYDGASLPGRRLHAEIFLKNFQKMSSEPWERGILHELLSNMFPGVLEIMVRKS